MKPRLGFFAAAFLTFSPAAFAGPLAGDFNTGPSLVEEANGASLNIRFHSCTEDAAKTCASVLEMVEPDGPSGSTVLPNGEPIVGFVMIRGLTAKGEGAYRSGEIAAIDESLVKGKMVWYGLKIDQNADGTLAATGCLGFICPRKMTWTAVGAPALPAARP